MSSRKHRIPTEQIAPYIQAIRCALDGTQGPNQSRTMLLTAADMLGRIGVRSRLPETLEPARGSVAEPAEARITERDVSALLDALLYWEADVRAEVAFALGELAGAEAMQPLIVRAQTDSDPDVRSAAVDALGKIGGPESIRSLQQIADTQPLREPNSAVRARAILALGSFIAPDRVVVLGRADSIRGTLKQARREERSEYVRDLADEILARLSMTA